MNFSIQSTLSYAHFIHWLIRDSIWRNKGLSFLILATGFLGVTFQVQVFALIIYYGRHFSSGEVIRLWRYEFDPRVSLGMLGVASLGAAVSLLLSALCIYFSRRSILRLGRKYGEFCAKRVFNLLGSGPDVFRCRENGSDEEKYLFRLVNADSRFCNRILLVLLSLIIPALTLAVAMGSLFYLEAFLTLLILSLLVVFAFFQSKVSRKTAAHSIRYEKLAPMVSQEYRTLIQHFKLQPQNNVGHEMVERLYEAGPVKRQLDAYEGLLSGVANSRLVSGILMALGMSLILLVMGETIIREGSGWGRLLVYVVALRYTITNLQSSFALVTSINRFYPQVRRYLLFVQSSLIEDKTGYPAFDHYELRAAKIRLDGSKEHLILDRGARLALVTPLELNRYTMAALARSLLGESEHALRSALFSMRFATARDSSPQMSLRKALGLNGRSTWQDLKAWFMDEGLWEMARQQLPNDLDKSIKQETWGVVEPRLKFVLGLISAFKSDCRWVLIEAKALSFLDQGSARFYLDFFKDRITVLVFNGELSQVGSYGEEGVAVTGEEDLLGLGSPEWFAGVRSETEERLLLERRRKKRKGAIEGEGEEDFLDEM